MMLCVWRVAAAVVLAWLLLGMQAVRAAEEDVRALLQPLAVQVPTRATDAPPFSVSDLSGAPVRLADYRGRPVMLYFWTTY